MDLKNDTSRREQQQRLMILALLCVTLVQCAGQPQTPSSAAPVTKSAPEKAPEKAPGKTLEKAKSTNSFVDSICVATHLGYTDTSYGTKYSVVKQKLADLGVRHLRDSGSSDEIVGKMKELASVGIKTTFMLDPNLGIAPNSSYWVKPPSYNIHDFVLKKVGTNVIDAVEALNEIDLFYDNYYWHPGDTAKVNNDPNSPLYWLPYVRSITKDTWTALKSDPATAKVKVIGPSLGVTYDYGHKSPLGDLSRYVDWGNFHPYPNGGNPFNTPFKYDTIEKYYWQGNFPSVNINQSPFAFDVYAPPFGPKPMAATETGYFTNATPKGISERMHGKYIPRLFLEYFRKGIVRTCSYEFVDTWKNPSDPQANYGMLRNDLSPKPAYTALKNLISVLKDPGPSFKTGSLNYTLNFKPPAGYERTEYVHNLLLQKRDGTFYLVLWHEISNGDISSTPVREITPPAIPTTVKLTKPISLVRVYSLDDAGNMSEATTTIKNNTISLNVPDKVTIVKLTPRK